MPVIVIAPSDDVFEKTASNMEEVIARGARVVFLSDEAGIARLGDMAAASIQLPTVDPVVAPILYAIPGATPCLPCRRDQGDGCRPAAEPRQSVTVE